MQGDVNPAVLKPLHSNLLPDAPGHREQGMGRPAACVAPFCGDEKSSVTEELETDDHPQREAQAVSSVGATRYRESLYG